MEVPAFDELPLMPGTDERHSWDVFGDKHEYGCLNFISPAHVLGAAQQEKRLADGRKAPTGLGVRVFVVGVSDQHPEVAGGQDEFHALVDAVRQQLQPSLLKVFQRPRERPEPTDVLGFRRQRLRCPRRGVNGFQPRLRCSTMTSVNIPPRTYHCADSRI